jgi:hypothetical protein
VRAPDRLQVPVRPHRQVVGLMLDTLRHG